jgi:hypothetical protein
VTGNSFPAAAEASYLTTALRTAGRLQDGCILQITAESDRANLMSRVMRLRLTYDKAEPGAPQTLILKTRLSNGIGGDWNGAEREVAFYQQIAPILRDGVVPRCFEARYVKETADWHLLLEDLTDSHFIATEWPLPPTQAQCQTILTARARLQAAWWDDPRLGVSVGAWTEPYAFGQYLQRLERHIAQFTDRLGDNLPRQRRHLFDRFLLAAPRLFARYNTHHNMTISHGDAHVWNCFRPRDGGDDVRLFDWDAWHVSIPTSDLAYMMAVHWYPDRRQWQERPLLDHYHAVLLTNGVTGYNRDALREDYRLSVLWQILTPVSQAANKIPPMIWWNNLERILMAVDDLGCQELLA